MVSHFREEKEGRCFVLWKSWIKGIDYVNGLFNASNLIIKVV